MDYLFLGILTVIAVIFLYYSLFKKKGCGCGSKGCGSTNQNHADNTKEHSHECCDGNHEH